MGTRDDSGWTGRQDWDQEDCVSQGKMLDLTGSAEASPKVKILNKESAN